VSKADSFDLVVLGTGPGGYVAAIRGAQIGMKVAIVEKDSRLGGTCLLRGCIPTKALLHSADLFSELTHAADHGVIVKEAALDFAKVMARKDKMVTANAKGVEFLMRKNKITVLNGFGRLDGKKRLAVDLNGGETKSIEFKNLIVATGSVPRMLPGLTADAKRIFTSDEILEMKSLPKSMLVLGSGAVGVEFASIFHRFGVDVTIVEMLPRLVPIEDEEVSEALEKSFKKQGIKVATGTRLENIRTTPTGVVADGVSDNGGPKTFEAEMLLVAIGRRPVSENIGLEGTGVKVDRGYLQVDEFLQTAEQNVYAIGDVIPTPWLAHVASHEGIVAVEHMAGRHPHAIDYERGVDAAPLAFGAVLVAISGGAGFLGLHLARRLAADGHAVRTLDLAPLGDAPLEGRVEELHGDVRLAADARRLVVGADVLVHAAAALPIQESRTAIRSVNVEGAAVTLAAAAEAGVRRVVLVSSTAVYGVPERHPIHEDDPLVGVGHYGESKIDAERLCEAFARRGLETVIVRPKTFVGPERLGVFEILFDWIREGRRIPILGDGANRYQLLAVEDLVDAIVRCLEAPVAGEALNVGAARFGTVREDLEELIRHAGSGSRLFPVPARPAEIALRGLELARLRAGEVQGALVLVP
jgi:dihydrolipoamide dehydrogenase